jgi:excisionase family DNA binding protein
MHFAKTEESFVGEKRFRGMNPSDEEPDTQHTANFYDGDDDMIKESKLMTVKEVADILRISRFSVYNLVKRGDLPAVKVLNKLRFSHQNIEDYLKKQKVNDPSKSR